MFDFNVKTNIFKKLNFYTEDKHSVSSLYFL